MTAFRRMLEHTDVRLIEGSRVGVLALHGGLEGGTAELAEHLSTAVGCTSLVFRQRGGHPWLHIPSADHARRDSPQLHEFLRHVHVVLSIHGHSGKSGSHSIYLGGANRALAGVLAERLRRRAPAYEAVVDIRRIPPKLRGMNPNNPVNQAGIPGVQVELPPSARRADGPATPGQPAIPDLAVAQALADAVDTIAEAVPDDCNIA
jgi:phage replication-related protein YjqB (UPF0714/DUF867 family)